MILRALLVLLVAIAAAALTYFGLERVRGTFAIAAVACRAVAWTALGLLLLNVSCPRPPEIVRPLVLLDGSLSMTGAGGRWAEARAAAIRSGDVRIFGDDRVIADSLPARGRSLLAPALAAASAAGRPVVIVSDGEIEDARDLPPDLLARATVRVLARPVVRDVAITEVAGPARVTAGDTLSLEIELRSSGTRGTDSVAVDVTDGSRRLLRRLVSLARGPRYTLRVPARGMDAGDHLLRIALANAADAEPRTDARLHLVRVTATPGIVVIAAPGDWDSKFLFRALRDVAQLPVRGYLRLDADRWRSMSDLRAVSADEVRRAAQRADLLVLKGAAAAAASGSGARGIWLWPSGENGETLIAGDWYLVPGDASPVAGAFLGAPVDSFPPIARVTPVQPATGDWVGLFAQESRRGAQRPVVIGRDDGRVRRVTVLADGLWRWAFRGGSSEQVYRSWVAATTTWLLAGADSARGVARPVRAVVQNGRPVIFEWVAAGPPRETAVTWTGAAARTDTLHFDGAGRAVAWLPVGEYRYRLAAGGAGALAVEMYSDEWLARPVVLAAHEGRATTLPGRTPARDMVWLFALAVLGLAGEWLARRRLGLR